jgi:CBS domain-containing protein
MLARMTAVADVMKREVLTVAPEDSLGDAAEKMTGADVGAVVVSDFGRLIGILTERDVMRAVARRTHSSIARVREWMTSDPITAPPEMDAQEAARTMLEHGFRHLPVVEDGMPVGIVSLRDIARWAIKSV